MADPRALALLLLATAASAAPHPVPVPDQLKAYCIDFNWGPGGPNAFPKPGLWADADPVAHVAWYKGIGCNVIQTFAVSCNGYAWYKDGVVPEQPGLAHDFLPEVVRLAHRENLLVFGYFCAGSNTRWGQTHPELSYGIPSAPHIPYTDEYLAYLDAAVRDAIRKSGMDGFMVDWLRMPTERRNDGTGWIEAEKKLYAQLIEEPFPGEGKVAADRYQEYGRRSLDRCWQVIRKAARETDPDCIVWLTSHDIHDPHLAGGLPLRDADWLLNEAGDIKRSQAARALIGPHTRLLTCLAAWNKQDPAVVIPDAQQAGIGLYGFTKPTEGNLKPPAAHYLAQPIASLENADDRHIAALARAFLGLPPDYVRTPVPKDIVRPTPEQVAYLEMERQMFVCLDPCTWQGREYDNHSTPLAQINPEKLDTDQWCRVAKSWGARQILFVAKHTGGFCWWQTETSRYGIKETPWKGGKGDVLRELSEACRRHGLKLAIYVYPGDDQWGAGIGSGGRTRDPARQAAYNEVFRQQLTEVLTRYGEMSEVWFDGSCVIEVGDLLQRHAPRAMVLQGPHTTLRWVGNEQGYAPYPAWQTVRRKDAETGVSTAAHSDPDGDVWLPLECDTTLIDHKWFWGPHTDHRLKSLDKLMDIYEKSAGRGCVLLLNSTPDTSGLIPQSHVQLYESFGQEIERRYGRPLAETNGLVLDFGRPLAVNAALLEEDIREGQRVRAYRWEGLAGGAWVPLHTNGLSVGRKQIDRFPRVEVSQLRFVATRSVGEPIIRRLAAFNVQRTVRGEPLQDVLYPFDEQAGAGRRGKDFEGAKASLGNLQIGDSDFTIAAAIFPRSCRTGQDRIVAKERIGVSANQFRLYLHEGNRLGFAMTDGASQGTAYPFVTAPDSVPTGRWTQVALTRRGADITLHLNGREAARTRTTGVIEHVNDLDLLVGAAYAAQGTRGDYAFDGDMARLRLYARALSPAELADPERLPDPGWTMALRWATNSFPAGGAADLDISAGLPRPGQYEVQFRPDAAGWSAERVDLVIGGQVLPGRVRRLEGRPLAFGLQRIEQTTAETPTILRVQARGDGAGSIWVRMQ